MNIKITSLYISNINMKQTVTKKIKQNSFCTSTVSVLYKKDALLIKVGNGYVDIDDINTEKDLKKMYNEVNALGDFRNGCGILRDTIPFFDEEGIYYVDHEAIRKTNYKGDVISFKKLKKMRNVE